MKVKYFYILLLLIIGIYLMKDCVEQFVNGNSPDENDNENTDPSIEGPGFNMCTCNSLCKFLSDPFSIMV